MTAQALRAPATTPAPVSATASATAASARERLPWLAKLTLVALLTPVFFDTAGLLLSPSRVMFLICVPLLTIQLLRGRYGGIAFADYAIFAFCAWMALAIAHNNPERLVTFVGSNVLILLGGYLVGRSQIRTPAQFAAFARFLGLMVAATLPFALYEGLTGHLTVAAWLEALPGVYSNRDVNYEARMGLDRVQFTLPHPIHYGLFCSLAFSLVLIGLQGVTNPALRLPWALAIGLCCFLSVSSGPFLSLLGQFALIAYAVATRRVEGRWTILILGSIGLYLVLDLISEAPAIYVILNKVAFSSHTAISRRIILEYGMAQVAQTPILGNGFHEWDLPRWLTGSVDNYWLVIALIYGVPAFAFLLAAFVWTLIKAGRQPYPPGSLPDMLRLGYAIVMVSMMFTLTTVAVWGEMSSIIMLYLGAGVWFSIYRPEDGAGGGEEGPAVAASAPRRMRLSRFPAVDAVGGAAGDVDGENGALARRRERSVGRSAPSPVFSRGSEPDGAPRSKRVGYRRADRGSRRR